MEIFNSLFLIQNVQMSLQKYIYSQTLLFEDSAIFHRRIKSTKVNAARPAARYTPQLLATQPSFVLFSV